MESQTSLSHVPLFGLDGLGKAQVQILNLNKVDLYVDKDNNV